MRQMAAHGAAAHAEPPDALNERADALQGQADTLRAMVTDGVGVIGKT